MSISRFSSPGHGPSRTGPFKPNVESVSNLRPEPDELLALGTTTVATGDAGDRSAIFTIESGTVLADPAATPAGGLRIAWPLNGLYDWGSINSNGEQILRNMIQAATGTLPGEGILITDVSFENGTGDFLVTFTPGGPDYILKASNDLLGAFGEKVSATLEDDESTFRVPAGNLNPGMEYFIIERKP